MIYKLSLSLLNMYLVCLNVCVQAEECRVCVMWCESGRGSCVFDVSVGVSGCDRQAARDLKEDDMT